MKSGDLEKTAEGVGCQGAEGEQGEVEQEGGRGRGSREKQTWGEERGGGEAEHRGQ